MLKRSLTFAARHVPDPNTTAASAREPSQALTHERVPSELTVLLLPRPQDVERISKRVAKA